MSVDGIVADFGVDEPGGFSVRVAVCGVVGADVVREGVVCGVEARIDVRKAMSESWLVERDLQGPGRRNRFDKVTDGKTIFR